jgi:hypothetical protein
MSKRKRTRAGRPERSDPRSIVSEPQTGRYLYTFTFRLPFGQIGMQAIVPSSARQFEPAILTSPNRKRDFQGEEHECDRGMLERRRSQLVGACAGAN